MLFMDEVMFVIIYERLEMIMILIVETIVLKILLFFYRDGYVYNDE